jgi:hypothetical protein
MTAAAAPESLPKGQPRQAKDFHDVLHEVKRHRRVVGPTNAFVLEYFFSIKGA